MKFEELQKTALKYFYTIEKNEFRTIIKKGRLDGSLNEIIISELDIGIIDISAKLIHYYDFNILKAAVDYAETPLDERQEEKRYIIPLPHLTTSDGEQQYLSHQGTFFASRRDKTLRQTWKEKDLIHIPEEYRGFAVEIEEAEEWTIDRLDQ